MIFNGREEIPHGTKRGTMEYLEQIITTSLVENVVSILVAVIFLDNKMVLKITTVVFCCIVYYSAFIIVNWSNLGIEMKARLRKKKFKKLCARIAEQMQRLGLMSITIDRNEERGKESKMC